MELPPPIDDFPVRKPSNEYADTVPFARPPEEESQPQLRWQVPEVQAAAPPPLPIDPEDMPTDPTLTGAGFQRLGPLLTPPSVELVDELPTLDGGLQPVSTAEVAMQSRAGAWRRAGRWIVARRHRVALIGLSVGLAIGVVLPMVLTRM